MNFAKEQVNNGLFSINRICILCGISKNTYYSFKHPNERFVSKYEYVKKHIIKIIEKNNAYGIKRIKTALWDEYSIHIGRDALGRLLNLWGLQIRRKIKKRKISLIKKILISLSNRTNLLIRTRITRPLQAISSDISEIVYNNGKNKASLAVHKDVFGQMVYGWKLSENQEVKIVLDSFNMAIKKIKKLIRYMPKNILFHQDQGSQFTSYKYVDKVLKNKMRLSYSTPGTPTDNSGQESFFGRLKDECQDEFNEVRSFKQLQRIMKKRMYYYNKKRRHTSIQLKSPEKFTINFIKNISLNQLLK